MYKQIVSVLMLSSLSTLALADMKPHGYVSGAVGTASYDLPGDESDTAFSLLGGYYFNKNLSIEGGYTDLGGGDVDDFSWSSSVLSITVKGSIPINEMFSLYGKAGIGFGSVDYKSGGDSDSESNTDLTYGVGASFRVSETFDINLGYDIYSIGDEESVDVDVLAIGATLHF